MLRKLIIGILCVSSFILCEESIEGILEKAKDITAPFNIITINNDNSSKFTHSEETVKTKVKHILRYRMHIPSFDFQKYQAKMLALQSYTTGWLTSHKYKLLLFILAGSYAFLYYITKQGIDYLDNRDRWYHWKKDMFLEVLQTVDQTELANELMVTVQTRYVDANNPTDFMQPLIQFMHDIDKEIKQLGHYKALFCWIERLYLNRLIFVKQHYWVELERRQTRALYIKQLFQWWLAQQNIKQHCFIQERPHSINRAIQKSYTFVLRIPDSIHQLVRYIPSFFRKFSLTYKGRNVFSVRRYL